MKRTICLLLVAVVSAVSLCAQESKKPVYVIDGQLVENFDGSQLEGVKVNSYSYDKDNNIHVITTSKNKTKGKAVTTIKTFTVDKNSETATESTKTSADAIKLNQKELIAVVDGKLVPYQQMLEMSPSQIDSMEVIKDKDNPEFQKYAKEYMKTSKVAPKCLIKVVTK